jgi:glycosyltransferase involved in cell wall biosynthesis
MRIGIAIEETWDFLHEIVADLEDHHDTTLFTRREKGVPFFKEAFSQYQYQQDLQKFLQSNDVVFFEWASQLLADATSLPKSCGIVTRLHRYEMYVWADKINWENVDKIILVSDAKKEEFSERFPNQAEKIVIIPEAVSFDRFQFTQKPYQGNLGTLARLQPRKRIYELILAFSELLNHSQDFHLHIGGDKKRGKSSDYIVALDNLVNKLNLRDKVTFYGNIEKPELWYPRLDIFISNSYSEGLQVSPMEAVACGCYCFSHFWDGADELLPKENLYYTEKEMVERILNYHRLSEGERQSRLENLHETMLKSFNIDKTKTQIRELIEVVGTSH